MSTDSPTTASVLTPFGRGAVAVVSVKGDLAEPAVDRWFQPVNQRPLSGQPLGRIVFGRWRDATGEEVLVCRRGNSVVEVHCHGGLAASAAITESLERAGCVSIPWKQTIADSELDPIAAATRIALAEAVTERTASILLDQYCGTLATAIKQIESLITAGGKANFSSASEKIKTLLERARVGLRLTKPWRVVFAGRPNVGKSSLINALVGYQRSIVYDTPGTTRDVVTTLTAFDGWPVELSDTAGQRTATDEIEAAGVARAQAECTSADLVLLVFDLAARSSTDEEDLLARYPQALIVYNKADIATVQAEDSEGLIVSAFTRQGIGELENAILARLIPHPPPAMSAVPFRLEQVQHLQAMLAQFDDINT